LQDIFELLSREGEHRDFSTIYKLSRVHDTDDDTRIATGHYSACRVLVLAIRSNAYSQTSIASRPAYRQGLSFPGVCRTGFFIGLVASDNPASSNPQHFVGGLYFDQLRSR